MKSLNSFSLHCIAMLCMLVDHIGQAFFSSFTLVAIGRIAYPIFAFLLVEGYFYTSDKKKYALRLLITALLSEIPFDLFFSGSFFDPFNQNVVFSLLLSFGLICLSEKIIEKIESKVLAYIILIGVWCIGCLLGLFTFLDYYHYGPMMVLVFYVTHKDGLWNKILMVLGICYINLFVIEGMNIPFMGLSFPIQGFAVLSLIPILLYDGTKGRNEKWVKYFYYGFYPIHLLLLAIIAWIVY